MRLSDEEAFNRLERQDHGVLCTVHPTRGVDAVPVVFAMNCAGRLAVPVDTVKPKTSTRLQRERNLDGDPRATLLVDHWDRHDWSRLWWVRAELRREPAPTAALEAGLAGLLVDRYEQYRELVEPFAQLIVFRIVRVTGWSAEQPSTSRS